MARKFVYLVPGFFGFTSLGSFNYFNRVSETLARALGDRRNEFAIVECRTLPTASIRFRARKLLEQVTNTGGLEAEEIHFIGHSTGGLDVRLLITPGVKVQQGQEEEEIAEKTRSVTTLSTPHCGTPLANFFTTTQGQHVLRILALAATTSGSRHLMFLVAQSAGMIAQLDDSIGRDDTFLDYIARRFLRSLTPGKEDPVWQFLKEVSEDQGAIVQLTPKEMNLFNASVADRPKVQYNCLLTAAPPPPGGYRLGHLVSPTAIALAAIFTLIHGLTARPPKKYPYPEADAELRKLLEFAYTFPIGPGSNDGIVPTLSQVHGRVLDAFVADHLDTVGQFRDAGDDRHADWLPSGAGFDERRFMRVWSTIAEVLLGEIRKA